MSEENEIKVGDLVGWKCNSALPLIGLVFKVETRETHLPYDAKAIFYIDQRNGLKSWVFEDFIVKLNKPAEESS